MILSNRALHVLLIHPLTRFYLLPNTKWKLKPGHSEPQTFKRLKELVVTIKNKDKLCCARAIVTAKAKVDGNPKWNCFKTGKSIQRTKALNLHWEVNVSLQACSYEELQKFALIPSIQDYQLLVIDETHSYCVDTFGPPQDKQLVLLYNQKHYDVVTTLPGYFQFPVISAAGASNHATMKVNMPVKIIQTTIQLLYRMSALTTKSAKSQCRLALFRCDRCKRAFYGETCLQQHFSRSSKGKVMDAMNATCENDPLVKN